MGREGNLLTGLRAQLSLNAGDGRDCHRILLGGCEPVPLQSPVGIFVEIENTPQEAVEAAGGDNKAIESE